jgi:hypothetical protein
MSSRLSDWLVGRGTVSLPGWVRFGQYVHEQGDCLLIAHVLDELTTSMEAWVVETSLELLAHIAVRHRVFEAYGGYLLCSDTSGQTFLLDLHMHRFIAPVQTCLLQIDGVHQAKQFIDVLNCYKDPKKGK